MFRRTLFLDKGKSMGLRNWGDEILLTVSEGNYSVKKLLLKKDQVVCNIIIKKMRQVL